MFTKDELIKITGSQVLKDTASNESVFSISTDTRTISKGDIYLPLKGESFDGEDFVKNAINSGARAYFTTRGEVIDGTDLVLKVEDTLGAYLKIAQYYRNKINPITVGITGSAGKTTTKEMIYSVLSQKYNTHKTYSNHNNEIGFCQTVLSMEQDTQALIVEMGMRGFGEIELITTHLHPDYAIITNCGSAHVGRLGSLDNIAIAKCEISKGLGSDGTIIALDQEITKKHLNFAGNKIFYSLKDVEIIEQSQSYSRFKYKGMLYELGVEGEYNIENSLAAIELGYKLGLSYEQILKGLKEYKPIEKRWEVTSIKGLNFINDSYNANPESVKASVKTFVDLYKNPVVVLGDMCELGDESASYHRQVGEYLAGCNHNVKYLTVGTYASEIAQILNNNGFDAKTFDNNKDVSCYIVENLNNSNTIFLKASRAMKLEEIIENIK